VEAEVRARPCGARSRPAQAERRRLFPIVGIGAAAGGLDACKRFFDHMPADTGTAIACLPHLGRTHESLMPELLGKHTAMPVHQGLV
jgi:two-component system CheB/CheR fusion protein